MAKKKNKKTKSNKQLVKSYYAGVRLHLPAGKTHSDKRSKARGNAKAELKRQMKNDEL